MIFVWFWVKTSGPKIGIKHDELEGVHGDSVGFYTDEFRDFAAIYMFGIMILS